MGNWEAILESYLSAPSFSVMILEYAMANLGQILKEEIARISRREIKKATATLQRSSAAYRREIAALKRHVAQLERALKDAGKRTKTLPAASGESENAGRRFSAQGFRTLRHRLGLSAAQIAKLLEVSEQSIWLWESKRTSPRSESLAKIVQLRGMGKREVARLLGH